MVPDIAEEIAQCRRHAAEYKQKAEQATRPSERELYFELHRSWLRLAIAREEEAELCREV
jgi:hypothetical protein